VSSRGASKTTLREDVDLAHRNASPETAVRPASFNVNGHHVNDQFDKHGRHRALKVKLFIPGLEANSSTAWRAVFHRVGHFE
jgi:hypothetical protein